MFAGKTLLGIFRIISLIFLIILITACSKNPEIVAEIGSHTITLEEFRAAYLNILKRPDVHDHKKLRETFLDELIHRRLYAEYARQNGFTSSEKYVLSRNAYRDKCMREAHFNEFIKPKIKIDSSQISEIYTYLRQQRKLKHLFAENRKKADSLFQQLEAGESWDVLAQQCFADENLAGSGGDLGWVYWDQLDYDMAMTAFRLKVGHYSKPIPSSDGYHILKLDDFKINPIVTKEEEKMHRRTSRMMLEQKIGDKFADEYIRGKMNDISIQAVPKIMKIVGDHLKESIHRQPSTMDRMNNLQLTEDEYKILQESLWNYRDEALLIVDGTPMTVGEFIAAANYIPYEAMYKSYKTALDFAIRDRVITAEAQDMQLNRKYSFVDMKTRLFEEYLLYMNVRREIVSNVKVTDGDMQMEFDRLKETSFKNMLPDSAKTFLHRQVLNKKKRNTVSDFTQKLKDPVTIHKYLDVIHGYYDNIVK